MSAVEKISWEITSDYIQNLAKQGKRQDNRKMDEYRELTLTPNYIPHCPWLCPRTAW